MRTVSVRAHCTNLNFTECIIFLYILSYLILCFTLFKLSAVNIVRFISECSRTEVFLSSDATVIPKLSFNLFYSLLLSPFLNSPYPIFPFKFWYLHYDIIVSDCCCQAAGRAASERQRSNCSHYCWRYYWSDFMIWSDLIVMFYLMIWFYFILTITFYLMIWSDFVLIIVSID